MSVLIQGRLRNDFCTSSLGCYTTTDQLSQMQKWIFLCYDLCGCFFHKDCLNVASQLSILWYMVDDYMIILHRVMSNMIRYFITLIVIAFPNLCTCFVDHLHHWWSEMVNLLENSMQICMLCVMHPFSIACTWYFYSMHMAFAWHPIDTCYQAP